MKHLAFLSLTVALCLLAAQPLVAAEVFDLRDWQKGIEAGRLMPFSFDIGDRPVALQFVGATQGPGENGWLATTVSYRDKTQPLAVDLNCEFPPTMDTVRTTLTLRATGSVIGNIRHIHILYLDMPNAKAAVHGQSGGFANDANATWVEFPPKGSRPWAREVLDGATLEIDSGRDGRSSNEQLPLWLYAEIDKGIWFGPEWSGCWRMAIRHENNVRRLSLELPTFDFAVKPGQTIVLPTAAFGPYAGDSVAGFNQTRRMIFEHYLPTIHGEKPRPFVFWQGYGAHPRYATEEELYREVDLAARIGCEVFCLDGGWNVASTESDTWYGNVGRWENQARFPTKGVKAFGEYVKSKGMKFGIWIEPRAAVGTPLHDKNPGLFHPGPTGLMRLDLPGGPEMFEGVFDQLVRDYGADWIWLDYNVAPRLHWWDKMEPADGRGLIELGFYQGWYKAIDRVLKKHPNLWIESCASGGRIIDLGQLRRSHSIWVSDQTHDDDANRNRRDALNLVLPAVSIQNSFFPASRNITAPNPGHPLQGAHRFLTYFSGDFGLGQGLPFWRDEDIRSASQYVALYKQYRRYLEGDYHHLTPWPESKDAWDACQYHDRQTQSGILFVCRLDKSKQETMTLNPRVAGNASQYRWSVVAGDAVAKADGDALTVSMAASNTAMIHYQRTEGVSETSK